jgi:hypothetical protein
MANNGGQAWEEKWTSNGGHAQPQAADTAISLVDKLKQIEDLLNSAHSKTDDAEEAATDEGDAKKLKAYAVSLPKIKEELNELRGAASSDSKDTLKKAQGLRKRLAKINKFMDNLQGDVKISARAFKQTLKKKAVDALDIKRKAVDAALEQTKREEEEHARLELKKKKKLEALEAARAAGVLDEEEYEAKKAAAESEESEHSAKRQRNSPSTEKFHIEPMRKQSINHWSLW